MTPPRPPFRRTVVRTLSTVAALALVAVAGAGLRHRLDPGRSEDPAALADEAAAILRAARTQGAQGRAPVNLAVAEEAYAQGLLERRRQAHRPTWLRDFRAARAALSEAVHRGGEAAALAERTLRRERVAATRAIAAGEAAVAALSGSEEQVWMRDEVRQRLQRARSLLREARDLLADGAHGEATERARRAREEADAVTTAVHASTSRFSDDGSLRTWRSWVSETVAWSQRTGKTAVVVDKDAHTLVIYQGGRIVREYPAELGWNNVGDKRHQGDGATPEGRYRISELKGRGRSRYHKALLLDYPNKEDLATLAELKRAGEVPHGTPPGGLIEIHGEGGRGKDWTDGCVAITNAQMDWLFARVEVGTPVTIVGSLSGDGSFSEVARRLER